MKHDMNPLRTVGVGILIVVPWLAIARTALVVCCPLLGCSWAHAALGGTIFTSGAARAGAALKLLGATQG
jgi:hypothetical protein